MKTVQEKFRKKVTDYALRGDYETGTKLAKLALEKDPDEMEYLYQYAKLLGDWADDLPSARKKKYKQESITILKRLQKRMSEADEYLQWGIGLNYYYQREDFAGMYRWGTKLEKTRHPKALYAQSVAASLRAGQLRPKKNARTWATRAIAAWKKYGLAKEKYYFPHYCLALAHAVRGENKLALLALEKAAKVSQRTVHCEEFADVLRMIEPTKKSK